MSGPYRFDGSYPDASPHGYGGCQEGHQESDCGGDAEHAELEGRAPGGKRQEVFQVASQRLGYPDSHGYPEHDAEQRHLGAEEQGSQRHHGGRHAESHSYADLPTLRVDDPAGEVERGKDRAAEERDRQDGVELLVALHVLDHEPDRRIVQSLRDGSAELLETLVERVQKRVLIRRWRQPEHEVVDLPVHARLAAVPSLWT